MELESLPAQYLPVFKKYWLPIVLGLLGLLLFVYGIISFLGSVAKPQDVTFKTTSETSSNSASNSQSLIQVDIEGAVISPGVYKLSANSIIKDALVSAGGLSAIADRDWAAKNLNLAAKLSDGAKVYIPKVGEVSQSTNFSDQISKGIVQNSSSINLNTASSQDLDSLPGVGPATASKIINSRPYSNINELLDKKAVSSKVFDQIKDKVSVY